MKINKKYILLSLLFCCLGNHAKTQILFTESFSVIIDSARIVQGSILPDFKFQTQKENLTEFENLVDITVRIRKNHAITLANKIEFSKYGSEVFLSGGYLYGEYRRIMKSKIVIEPYSQIQWAEARGMEWKVAGGINMRYRFLANDRLGLFAGAGPFFEYERWNYEGVPEEVILPPDTSTITRRSIKLGSYISCKGRATDYLFFDLSVYYQSPFDEFFTSPRIATSTLAKINITRYLGFNIIHQFIYDHQPVVPIKKQFHRVIFGFSVDF